MVIVTSYNLPAVLLPFLIVLFVSGAVLPVRFTEGQSETFDPWVDGGQGTGHKILVNVNNVTKYCGEDIIIGVGEIQKFVDIDDLVVLANYNYSQTTLIQTSFKPPFKVDS